MLAPRVPALSAARERGGSVGVQADGTQASAASLFHFAGEHMNTRQFTSAAISLAALLAVPLAAWAHDDHDHDHGARVAIRDDCDPNDPRWAPSGGCHRKEGDVDFGEFTVELSSALAPTSVIGHQAWRMDPSYIEIEEGDGLMVRNRGGRTHTFAEVQSFGGGKIPNPALNKGLLTAPECPTSVDIAPGGKAEVSRLGEGNHHFQCCIHPWMRAIVKVKREE